MRRLDILICTGILLQCGFGSPLRHVQRWSPHVSTTQKSALSETRALRLNRNHVVRTGGTEIGNIRLHELKLYAYVGVPVQRYYIRATRVHQGRVQKWTLGIGRYFRCRLRGQRCSLGLICVGPSRNKQCRRPVPKGGVCDDLYLSCDADHECQFGRCRTPARKNEKCTLDSLFHENWNLLHPFCAQNLYCDPHQFVCRWRRREHQNCSTNNNSCRKGLVCDTGKCRSKIGLGHKQQCGAEFKKCKRGLMCAVRNRRDRMWQCLPPKFLPLTCIRNCPFAEYQCRNGTCWRRLGMGEKCMGTRFALCKRGLRCKWKDEVVGWRCTKSRVPDSYECVSKSDCGAGMYCHETLNKCLKRGAENETCSNSYLCKRGLVCNSRKCRKLCRIGLNRVCGWQHGECKSELLCAIKNISDFLPKCLNPEETAIECQPECPEGYICWKSMCWRLLQKGESCMTRTYAICAIGLSCDWKSGWRCNDDL